MSEQLRRAAQQALDALELAQTEAHWELNSPTRKFLRNVEKYIRAALEQPEYDPLDMPLEAFLADLRTQTRNTINAATTNLIWYGDRWVKQPRTVRNLMMFSRLEIKTWPSIGRRSLQEIDQALRNIGLQLRDHPDERSLRLLDSQQTVVADPTQRQPLTDEEIMNIGKKARAVEGSHILPVTFARAIEQAHGIGAQP